MGEIAVQERPATRDARGRYLKGAPAGPGRDTLYSPEIAQAICDNLAKGATPEMAAAAVGVNPDTFYHWQQTRFGFSEMVSRARATVHVEMAGIVTGAAKGEVPVRQAEPAIEFLKRRDKGSWGDTLDIRKVDTTTLLQLLQAQQTDAITEDGEPVTAAITAEDVL